MLVRLSEVLVVVEVDSVEGRRFLGGGLVVGLVLPCIFDGAFL